MTNLKNNSGAQTQRRTPKQQRAIDRADAILNATATVLRELGYAKTNTNNIAKTAGVPVGSIYAYFKNKDTVIAAMMQRIVDDRKRMLMDVLANANADHDVATTISRLVTNYIDFHVADAQLYKVIFEEVPQYSLGTTPHETDHEMTQIFRKYLATATGASDDADLDLAAFVVLHAVESVVHQAISYRPDLTEQGRLAQACTRLITSYINN